MYTEDSKFLFRYMIIDSETEQFITVKTEVLKYNDIPVDKNGNINLFSLEINFTLKTRMPNTIAKLLDFKSLKIK